MGSEPVHGLSIDVEDWWNATVLQELGSVIPPRESLQGQVGRLLDLLCKHGARATWFFLGEVAERFPSLLKKVAEAGHELGVHGWHHYPLWALPGSTMVEHIRRAKACVEEVGGVPASGFRAVDFSLDTRTWGLLDSLIDLGFKYDSSVFPMRSLRYGIRSAPGSCFLAVAPSGRVLPEIPVTVYSKGWVRLPFAGGGYFRVLPRWLLLRLMADSARRGPVVFYFHPCEFDRNDSVPEPPGELTEREWRRVLRRRSLESLGRAGGSRKLESLLARFRFGALGDVLKRAAPGLSLRWAP